MGDAERCTVSPSTQRGRGDVRDGAATRGRDVCGGTWGTKIGSWLRLALCETQNINQNSDCKIILLEYTRHSLAKFKRRSLQSACLVEGLPACSDW